MLEQQVFVVDDDSSVRKAVGFAITAAGLPVRSFDSADAFLSAYDDGFRGCIVLDVKMPGRTGPELQEILNERGIDLPIVFLTGHGDVPTSVRSMKNGAVDFVEKPCDKNELLDIIRYALKLEARRRHDAARRSTFATRYDRLTAREQEVMELLVLGKQTKSIARELHISPKTVDNHRTKVLEKMRVDNAVELVRLKLAAEAETEPDADDAALGLNRNLANA